MPGARDLDEALRRMHERVEWNCLAESLKTIPDAPDFDREIIAEDLKHICSGDLGLARWICRQARVNWQAWRGIAGLVIILELERDRQKHRAAPQSQARDPRPILCRCVSGQGSEAAYASGHGVKRVFRECAVRVASLCADATGVIQGPGEIADFCLGSRER
jgi:hypothetical protein